MNKYIVYILAGFLLLISISACQKEDSGRVLLPDNSVKFDMPETEDVVANELDVREVSLLTLEMRAVLTSPPSSGVHYVTFAPDTTKLAAYQQKYGDATLLPAQNYLYYKPTVAISSGNTVSESGVLNLSFQTTLKANSTYVLPLAVMYVDGQLQDPTTRSVVYYVFNTGDALYVDHTGYTVTATASSTAGTNTASRVVDANNTTTFWASGLLPEVLPQWLQVDYGREITFSGLDLFYPTSVNYATTGGDPNLAKVEVSSDGANWEDIGTYRVDVRNDQRKHSVIFPSPVNGQYLRFTILDAAPYVAGTASHNVTLVSGIMLRN